MAVAVKGCSIMGGSGSTLCVRRRCEACGHRDGSFIEVRRPRRAQRVEFRYRCPACGHRTDCLIIGG